MPSSLACTFGAHEMGSGNSFPEEGSCECSCHMPVSETDKCACICGCETSVEGDVSLLCHSCRKAYLDNPKGPHGVK